MASEADGSVVVLTHFFFPAVKAGGPVRSLVALTESEVGHRVRVIAGDRDLGDHLPTPGLTRGTWLKHGNGHVMYVDGRSVLTLWRAFRALKALRPGHVYVNSLFAVRTGLVPLLMARLGLLGSTRIVLAPRGQLDPGALRLGALRKRAVLRGLLTARLLRDVRWHATSELEVGHVRQVAGSAAEICLALPVPERHPPVVERVRPSRPLRLVFLGRITPKKGLHLLIQAIEAVDESIHLDVFGPRDDAAYAEKCVRSAARLPRHHRVDFHGTVGHDRVPALLQGADVFVLPTEGENFGHAIFEALSAGCPVILTPTTPWTSVVHQGAGWIVDAGDAPGLAKAIGAASRASQAEFRAMSAVAADAAALYLREAEGQDGWVRLFSPARPSVLVLGDHYTPGYKAGGPIRSLVAMTQLDLDGDVRVLTRDRDLGDRRPYPGIRAGSWLRDGSSSIMYLRSDRFRSLFQVWWQAIRQKPTCIYVNSLFSPWFGLFPMLLWRLGLLGRPRLVLAPRGQMDPGALTLNPRRKSLVLWALARIGLLHRVRWHAESDIEAKHIRALVGGSADIRVLTSMPDPTSRTRETMRPHLPLRLVFVSRVSPKKGLLVAILALSDVTVPVVLDVYGPEEDPAYAQACRQASAAAPAGVEVRFHGPIEHARVSRVLQEADLFVLPTLGENFGHAILEALAMGCPVVITDRTPWTSAVTAGAGALVDPGDAAGTARAINRLVAQDPCDWARMSAAAVTAADAHRQAGGAGAAEWERLFWAAGATT